MKKRFLCIAVLLAISIVLSSCGSQGKKFDSEEAMKKAVIGWYDHYTDSGSFVMRLTISEDMLNWTDWEDRNVGDDPIVKWDYEKGEIQYISEKYILTVTKEGNIVDKGKDIYYRNGIKE